MNRSEKLLLNKWMELSIRAVLIRCLNEKGQSVATAGGFIDEWAISNKINEVYDLNGYG